MGRRVSPKHVAFFALLMAAAGAVLLAWGSALSAFVDQARADNAFSNWCSVEGRVDDKAGEAYFALMTNRYSFVDGGFGLISAGFALLALTATLCRGSGPVWLKSPAHRWTFFALGVGVLLASWGATVRSIVVDQQRGFFPPCADSIAIGLAGVALFFIVMIPFCLALGFSISRWFGTLPATLGAWDRTRVRYSWLVSIIFGGAVFGAACVRRRHRVHIGMAVDTGRYRRTVSFRIYPFGFARAQESGR